jgi:hypothetical protein
MRDVRPRIATQEGFILDKLLGEEVLKSSESLTAPSSFIVPYDPHDERAAREVRRALISDLKARGHRVCDVDLYVLYMQLLDESGSYEDVVEVEPEYDADVFIDMMNDIVDAETMIVPTIIDRIDGADLLFLSGVGACYPFLRVHRLLEMLHPDVPMVTFFPGMYHVGLDGRPHFDVLDVPQEGNTPHYRARNLYDL